MSKALVLGNGQMLVALDKAAQVRDLYYPHVGLENHIGGDLVHRIGVYTAGQLSWLGEPGWVIKVDSEKDSLVGQTEAVNSQLQVALTVADVVYNEKNIFLRRVTVKNLSAEERVFNIFFHQQFELAESQAAHTAYYDPINKAIVHYRNRRAFLINTQYHGQGFSDFSTGVFGSEGKEGTHIDAADGVLAKNPIEHGQADSVVGVAVHCAPGAEETLHYWLAAGDSVSQVLELNHYVLERGPEHLQETTDNFWRAWINRRQFSFYGLTRDTVTLFNKSLMIIRAHTDEGGGIIASSDANSRQRGKDTYCYVWPRDGVVAALALARAGDFNVARKFFTFCFESLGDSEYFMHKYGPDKSLGSSWLPWFKNGEAQLPIQEDETALVLMGLWEYYELSKDLEFVEALYNPLIKKTADFMVLYRDDKTGLPRPSYDLWEEKFGVSTFTAASVYGALIAASRFAALLGKVKNDQVYRLAAGEIKEGIMKHLYNAQSGMFYKLATFTKDEIHYDATPDISSAYGAFAFGVLPAGDDKLARALQLTREAVSCHGGIGGLARYEGDSYYRGSQRCPANPWFVTTLWLAQYYIKTAKTEADLAPARETFQWVLKYALPSGILSEQLDPETGEQLSVGPLVWSHAEFVNSVIMYLNKLEELGICQACNPVS
jgi:GH15 family glucan-1,4-alpha-glucosidase